MKSKPCCKSNCNLRGVPTLYWLSLILGFLLVVFLFFITKKRNNRPVSQQMSMSKRTVSKTEIIVEASSKDSEEKDDLTILSGIGPVISDYLHSRGISTFEKLSKMQPNDLQDLLIQRNLRLNNAETWPHQAKLAASKQWQALNTYIKELKNLHK